MSAVLSDYSNKMALQQHINNSFSIFTGEDETANVDKNWHIDSLISFSRRHNDNSAEQSLHWLETTCMQDLRTDKCIKLKTV